MNKNYHTHTPRCHHATGNEEEYIKAAIKAGHSLIGFSDHSPWQYDSSYRPTMRMEVRDIKNYVETLRRLKEKYSDQITVKIGFECEYFPKYMDWLKEMLEEYQIDYIILGNHFKESDELGLYYGSPTKKEAILKSYVDDAIHAFETGLYSYIVHPDLIHYQHFKSELYKQEITRLCLEAKKRDIPLEFNLLGYSTHRHYPNPIFWQIAAEVGNKAILGIDAHDLFQYEDEDSINEAENYLKSLGIEIVDDIRFLR